MDIQTLLVYLIFALCVLSALRWFYKRITRKKGSGCGCDCPGCTAAEKKDENSCCCCPGDKNHRTYC